MITDDAYVIRCATPADTRVLRRLAALDDQRSMDLPALIGQVGDRPVAAMSLVSRRVVADPFVPTAAMATHLRLSGGQARCA